MKKLLVIALVVAVGVTAGYASSLKVPWFVDTSGTGAGNPPDTGVLGLVFLTSNAAADMTCSITYYDANGVRLGPDAPNNTFTIGPNAALAFRPATEDPSKQAIADGYVPSDSSIDGAGGQEELAGALVPDQPDTAAVKNGSILIEWTGGDKDLQGSYSFVKGKNGLVISYAHLLPPGV